MEINFEHFNIEDLYSCESLLDESEIERNKSLGLEGLLELIRSDPIKIMLVLCGNKRIISEIDVGHHNVRSLYELGERTLPKGYYQLDVVEDKEDHDPPKIHEVELVSKEEHTRYMERPLE